MVASLLYIIASYMCMYIGGIAKCNYKDSIGCTWFFTLYSRSQKKETLCSVV